MGYGLKSLCCVIASGCILASGCATVDMTEVALTKPETIAKSTDVNVVQRAATKLYTAFTNKGFVAKTSRNKMRTAAMTLLKGLNKSTLNTKLDYASSVTSSEILKNDMILATRYVEQTHQAAEIYLAMAPGDNSLRKELGHLEKALLASGEAGRSFTAAQKRFDSSESLELLASYNQSIQSLRTVTDAFGQRVRSDVMTSDNGETNS